MWRAILLLAALCFCAAAQAQTAPCRSVPVAAAGMAAGTVLTPEAIRIACLPPGEAMGAAQPSVLDGMALRRSIAAGSVLRATDVETPRVIQRGSIVTLRITGNGFAITTTARALVSAGLGERLRLRLEGSARMVEAIATGMDTAQMQEL